MFTLFHGSNAKFKEFKISEDLTTTRVENLREGLGIYMTDDTSLSDGYGKYRYILSIKEKEISDFTDKDYIIKLFKTLSKKIGFNIFDFIQEETFIQHILNGGLDIVSLYEHIQLALESNEYFYHLYEDKITFEDDCLFEDLKKIYLDSIKDVVKYYDRSFNKNIFICFRNPQNLTIVDIKELY